SEANAIRLPSGDHEGALLPPGGAVKVSCAWLRPSASITQISGWPVLTDEKATWVPSGDQDGTNPVLAGGKVNWVWLPPSASITQSSGAPVRPDVKAIFSPS